MRERDVREAEFGGDLAEAPFVRGVAVSVQQADGERLDPLRMEFSERGAGGRFVEPREDGAIRGQAFADLDGRFVQLWRLIDAQVEERRPVLVTDPQRIHEPGGGDEGGARAAAFEQRVGRPCSAQTYAHGADRFVQVPAEQPADSGDGRFFG